MGMIRYVIATHGKLAEGFLSALQLFVGDQYSIETICAFLDEESLEKKANKILSQYTSDDEVIIMTDMYGGSVNQFFTKEMLLGNNYHVITGINLGLTVELILCLQTPVEEIQIKSIIQQAKDQIVYMNQVLPSLQTGED